MPEEKVLSDILREALQKEREISDQKIAVLEAKISGLSPLPVKDSKSATSLKHKTAKELSECTDCNKEFKFEDYDKSVLKKYGESLKGKETVTCKDCGLSVEREKESCPGCGGTEEA